MLGNINPNAAPPTSSDINQVDVLMRLIADPTAASTRLAELKAAIATATERETAAAARETAATEREMAALEAESRAKSQFEAADLRARQASKWLAQATDKQAKIDAVAASIRELESGG